MEGNRDDAERCYEMGRAALEGGDQARAARLLAKSVRLFPLPKAEKLLAQIKHAPEANAHHTNGVNGGHSSHHRTKRTHAAAAADDSAGPSVSSEPAGAPATPEQIAIVRRIRSTTDYYEVLQLSKDCADEDVRKAYRKIALKLHPDKNKAPGAEEAFKTVSKAFSCLSDKDKRANYDRFGHEDGAQGRLQQQRQAGGRQAYYEEFDPNDIFNAFFYGMNGQGQHFRAHMHNRQRRAQQHRAGSDEFNITGLIQLIPVLLLLIASYFYNQSEPAFSLARENGFLTELRTERLNIPFYVKSAERFQAEYPLGKQSRARIEHAVEDQFRQQLESKCSYEQMQHQYLINRGRKQEARDMHMPYCELLSSTFRYNAPFRRSVY